MRTTGYSRPQLVRLIARRRPGGRPGFICIDSVHQGDQDEVKGVRLRESA